MTVFVLTSRYLKPLDAVDNRLPAHVAWVSRQYEEGRILVSGRQTPPVGGAIVMVAADEAEVLRELGSDPFHAEGLAEYSIVAFEQTPAPRRAAAFDVFLDAARRPRTVITTLAERTAAATSLKGM